MALEEDALDGPRPDLHGLARLVDQVHREPVGDVADEEAGGGAGTSGDTQTSDTSAVFLRGDADRDETLGLSDAVLTLGHLFRGEGELLCEDAADANDDGEIDRDEFATIMDSHETTAPERREIIREAIAKQSEEAKRAEAVAEMLMEYRGEGNLRQHLRDIFADIAGPDKDPEEDEIDVRDLIGALKRDSDGDGSLSEMLQLPRRLRFDDGSRDRFETIFREIDTDGSKTIDFGEFFAYFRSLKKERCGEIVRAAVERMREDDSDSSSSSSSSDDEGGDDDIAALVEEDERRRKEEPEGVDAVAAGTAALARRWAKKVHGKEKINTVVNTGAVAAAAMAQRWQRKTFAHRNE